MKSLLDCDCDAIMQGYHSIVNIFGGGAFEASPKALWWALATSLLYANKIENRTFSPTSPRRGKKKNFFFKKKANSLAKNAGQRGQIICRPDF